MSGIKVLYADKRKVRNEWTALLTRNLHRKSSYILSSLCGSQPGLTKKNESCPKIHSGLLSLHSIESDSQTVVGRSDLRCRVRIRSTDECLLQCRRLAPKFGHDVVGRGGIGSSPIVARGGVQDVGCTRCALPTVAWSALRCGIEESAGGYVGVVIDIVGEALAVVLGRGRQCSSPVASLLQAHVAPCRAHHVHFHPRGWEGLAALDGAGPAVVEGHKLGFAAVEGDVL